MTEYLPFRLTAIVGVSSLEQRSITWGSLVIDVDVYLKMTDLFRFRYDPAVLGLIAERPHRFRELVSRLETHVDGHVDDNAVGRSLKRLARIRHVHRVNTRVGRRNIPIYTITDTGCEHLRVYSAFIDAYQRTQLDTGSADDGPDPRLDVP